MSVPRLSTLSLALLSLPGVFACRQNPLVQRANPTPRAIAMATPARPMTGPATVMLDASPSMDDGVITKWQWLSATPNADGTPARRLPDGITDKAWPDDTQRPTVTLPEGYWLFNLWVTDDRGAISDPYTLCVTVGNPAGMPPKSCVATPAGGAAGMGAAGMGAAGMGAAGMGAAGMPAAGTGGGGGAAGGQ